MQYTRNFHELFCGVDLIDQDCQNFADNHRHRIFYLRMSNHMNFKLILSSEALFADCAGKPLLRMKCFNVLPYARILFKSFFTMRTSEIPFSLCS